ADGLDTLAEVKLNGEVLGVADNQFRRWRWEVGVLLRGGDNTLEILFSSPVADIAAQQSRRRMNSVSQTMDGAPHLRKAPCQFGWDWGPKLPSIGIWKDVRLEGRSVARMEDVHLRQVHGDGVVTVRADVRVEAWSDGELDVALTVSAPDKTRTYEAESKIDGGKATLAVQVDDPLLWWPNGYGEQNLYDVTVAIRADGRPVDRSDDKTGLRTIELRQENDAWGRSFRFVVNGVAIFVKGSNWIPADSFVTRVSDEHLDHLIRSVAATHQTMLRVWGGGFYEDDRF
ncbi:unnamed protein product, partial [marine sediment metagenome]